MTSQALAQALLSAVLAQDFGNTPDAWAGGAAVAGSSGFPSIDLALVVFPRGGGAPVAANVLFSREHPRGFVAQPEPGFGAVQNVRFVADVQGKTPSQQGDSIAWLPGSDWAGIHFPPLGPAPVDAGATRFVAPYPASLIKLLVAVGVALAVDEGRAEWRAALTPMITVSSNEATDECVALLHGCKLLPHEVNSRFARLGLGTLQLNKTTRSGGWRNASGSGVGQLHITAWDMVRLLWLLDAQAPPPPWLPPGTPPLLSAASRGRLRAALAAQQLDEILSSGALKGVPGWVPGGPDAPVFAHKTGTTDNYASDAGIWFDPTTGTHALVAVLTSLGRRYAPHADCATTWRLPALGAAVWAAAKAAS